MNGRGEIALGLWTRRRRAITGRSVLESASFQFGSLSHSSLRSSAFCRAREASSSVEYGPSRSIGGQRFSVSTR